MSQHNILSFNQMAHWKHGVDHSPDSQEQLIDEYFECLIDCDNDNLTESSCRRVCSTILK